MINLELTEKEAKLLQLYLLRSCLMISDWECRNPIIEEAECGNEHSKEILHTRNRMIDRLYVLMKYDSAICKDCESKSNKVYCHTGLKMLNKKKCRYFKNESLKKEARMFDSESGNKSDVMQGGIEKILCPTRPVTSFQVRMEVIDSYDKGIGAGCKVDGVLCLSISDAVQLFTKRLGGLWAEWDNFIKK